MGLRKLLPALLLIAGCRSASLEPGIDRLSGTWRWISSSGGIAGTVVTPQAAGYTAQLPFAGSQVTVLRNDSVKGSTTFRIRADSISYQPALPTFVYGPGMDAQRWMMLPGDTLVLNDPCCDLFTHVFVRAP